MYTSVGKDVSVMDTNASSNYNTSMKKSSYGDTINERHGTNNNESYSTIPFDIMNDRPTTGSNAAGWQHGPGQYQFCDIVWSILFLIQFVVMVVLSIIYIPQMIRVEKEERRRETSDDDTYNVYFDHTLSYMYFGMLPYFAVCGFLTIFLISMIINIMVKHADRLIQLLLCFNVFVLTEFTIFAVPFGVDMELLPLPLPYPEVWGTLLLIYCISVTVRVWRRIPTISPTIIAAMTVVRDNMGKLSLYAYLSFLLTCAYLVLLYTFCRALNTIRFFNNCENGPCTERVGMNGLEWSLAFASLYWTSKVFTNIM
jgi:hypothetical protein